MAQLKSTQKRYEKIRNRHEELRSAKTKRGGKRYTKDQIFEILNDEFFLEIRTLENIVYFQVKS